MPTLSKQEKSCFYYFMGFYTKDGLHTSKSIQTMIHEKMGKFLSFQPCVSWDDSSKCVEGLLVSRFPKTERRWHFLSGKLFGSDIHIQVEMLVAKGEGTGRSCVERLIDKMIKQASISNNNNINNNEDASGSSQERPQEIRIVTLDSNTLDIYRMVTGGLMHHMDNRSWKMSKRGLVRLHEECKVICDCIRVIHEERYKIMKWLELHSTMISSMMYLEEHESMLKTMEVRQVELTMNLDQMHSEHINVLNIIFRQHQIRYEAKKKRLIEKSSGS